VADEFRKNQPLFARKAKEHTAKYARTSEAQAVAETDHQPTLKEPALASLPLPDPEAAAAAAAAAAAVLTAAHPLPRANLKRPKSPTAITDSKAADTASSKRSAP
jgi:hypothetical protein